MTELPDHCLLIYYASEESVLIHFKRDTGSHHDHFRTPDTVCYVFCPVTPASGIISHIPFVLTG